MAQYNHILLAIDVCGDYQPVIERALALRGKATKMSLIHVVEPVYYPENYVGGLTVDLHAKSVEFAQSELEAAVSRNDLPDNSYVIESGSPAKVIREYAESNAADLIVIGSHGKRGLQLLLGSTATGVLHGATCDVLAVRVYD